MFSEGVVASHSAPGFIQQAQVLLGRRVPGIHRQLIPMYGKPLIGRGSPAQLVDLPQHVLGFQVAVRRGSGAPLEGLGPVGRTGYARRP